MAGFKTGAPELERAAKQLEEGNASLQQALAKLAQEVEGVQGSWGGAAAKAFHTLMEHFEGDAKKLNDSLQQISDSISSNASAYRQQEEEAEQSISAITSALG